MSILSRSEDQIIFYMDDKASKHYSQFKFLELLTLEKMQKFIGVKIFGLFSYGSTVYENKDPEDLDFIIITDKEREQIVYDWNGVSIQVTFYTLKSFEDALTNQEMFAIECLSISLDNNGDKLIHSLYNQDVSDLLDEYKPNSKLVRSSTSEKSSNSYVKAKKKITLKEDFDFDASLKSLWHSLRMVDFAIQVCKFGYIKDFSSMNEQFDEVAEDYEKFSEFNEPTLFWDFIHSKYKSKQNNLLSQLRKLAPK